MARAAIGVVLGCVLLCGGPALAQTAQRLNDKDVKALIEAVDNGRDRFEDQLDGRVKNSVQRGAAGEVDVSRFLDDFQESVGRLKDRFKPDYAASAEAAAVLRQGSGIQVFMKQQPADLKGASEWDTLAGNLNRLATAYGTRFPVTTDSVVRRVSDDEAATAAALIEEQANEFKNTVNGTKGLPSPTKNSLKSAADAVKSRAKTLASRLKDSKPATAEARLLVEAMQKLDDTAKGAGVAASSLSAMGAMRAPLATLRQAFGVAPPPGT